MALSDFRMKKFMYLFNVFFDINRSGSINKEDFEIATQNVCKVRGWKTGDANYEKTKKVLDNVWRGLQEKADADKDEQVTSEEWCKMWQEYASNPNAVLDWQIEFRDFMFELEDTSGDGTIDEDEFSIICGSYNIPENEARAAFKKMTAGGDKEISNEKFAKLWLEYFSSDDPSSPGNFIFGVSNFN